MERKGYTNIPDWMLDYDLDVYETIILAVIFGFSQDGESTFTGSQKYLAEKAKCSKRKVATALVSLCDKGLIKKIDKDIRGIHLCEYYCTSCKGIAPDARGIARCATNNIIDNIDINRERVKRAEFQKPSVEEVREYCNARHNGIDPEEFVAFYESKGWMVGKSKMKDWKSAIITWEKAREKQPRIKTNGYAQRKETALETNLKVMDEMFGTSYHSQVYGSDKEEVTDEQ